MTKKTAWLRVSGVSALTDEQCKAVMTKKTVLLIVNDFLGMAVRTRRIVCTETSAVH